MTEQHFSPKVTEGNPKPEPIGRPQGDQALQANEKLLMEYSGMIQPIPLPPQRFDSGIPNDTAEKVLPRGFEVMGVASPDNSKVTQRTPDGKGGFRELTHYKEDGSTKILDADKNGNWTAEVYGKSGELTERKFHTVDDKGGFREITDYASDGSRMIREVDKNGNWDQTTRDKFGAVTEYRSYYEGTSTALENIYGKDHRLLATHQSTVDADGSGNSFITTYEPEKLTKLHSWDSKGHQSFTETDKDGKPIKTYNSKTDGPQ